MVRQHQARNALLEPKGTWIIGVYSAGSNPAPLVIMRSFLRFLALLVLGVTAVCIGGGITFVLVTGSVWGQTSGGLESILALLGIILSTVIAGLLIHVLESHYSAIS